MKNILFVILLSFLMGVIFTSLVIGLSEYLTH